MIYFVFRFISPTCAIRFCFQNQSNNKGTVRDVYMPLEATTSILKRSSFEQFFLNQGPTIFNKLPIHLKESSTVTLLCLEVNNGFIV